MRPVCDRHFSYLRTETDNHVQDVSVVVTVTDVRAKFLCGKLAHWPCAAVCCCVGSQASADWLRSGTTPPSNSCPIWEYLIMYVWQFPIWEYLIMSVWQIPIWKYLIMYYKSLVENTLKGPWTLILTDFSFRSRLWYILPTKYFYTVNTGIYPVPQ